MTAAECATTDTELVYKDSEGVLAFVAKPIVVGSQLVSSEVILARSRSQALHTAERIKQLAELLPDEPRPEPVPREHRVRSEDGPPAPVKEAG